MGLQVTGVAGKKPILVVERSHRISFAIIIGVG